MHVNQFWWAWQSGFRDIATSQIWLNFPFGPWTIIVHGGQKIESAQKFMQVEGDVKCAQKPILVDMATLVLEILLLLSFVKFIVDHFSL